VLKWVKQVVVIIQ